jgi:hypothetical protein
VAYASPLKPNEDENGQQPGLTSASGEIIGGNTGNPGAAQAAPAMPANSGGSQFPDVSRYLSQNAQQGKRLAAKVGGNVVQAGNQARNLASEQAGKLNNATQSFNQNLTANKVAPANQNIINRAASNPTSFFQPMARDPGRGGFPTATATQPYPTKQYAAPGGRMIDAPAQSTASFGGPLQIEDQAGLDQFKGMRDAAYKGPSELGYDGDYQGLDQSVSAASDATGKAKTDSGRLDLLRSLYGGGVNSPGVANLDNFLLRGSGAQNVIGRAAAQNAGVEGLGTAARSAESAAETDALGKAKAENDAATGVRNQVQDAFLGPQGAYTQFDQGYDARLSQAQQDAKKTVNQYFGHSLNPDQQVPETEAIRNELLGLNNVASQDDYDKLQAINELLGSNYGF